VLVSLGKLGKRLYRAHKYKTWKPVNGKVQHLEALHGHTRDPT
jgi:hypothetical protein